ncbi:long-chain fatty acid--CoA ligase [Ancylomarina sp. 16SWW S1-10-2]|uniref:AMP-dependent synthetase/ligase n=1 Tax=Ancylomarina sp. 16SWW S1-10-2 TaxID=2499681 RepID=UPI0012AD2592|nr:AMP-binding protein [Ancylomarina sp. 16SWW S1-10-2]MRT93689.1 long-chain fatty acid--CoA ligase [Ancylomarina sp. 16SWW S1-10-2]
METIIQLFENSVKQFSNNPFLWEKTEENYTSQSYKELHSQVLLLAAGLYDMGIKKGDRIGLLSEGRNAWVLSELGILYSGAVNVPLSVKLDAQNELKFRLQHSESRLVIVSKNNISKIREIKDDLDLIEHIIVIDDDVILESKEIYLSSVIELGKNLPDTDKNNLIKLWSAIKPNDNANISYTSGTTADPKGIILSHINYTSNVIQASSLMDIPETYKTLLILPWDHSFAHTAGIYSFMLKGASIAAVQQGKSPMEALKNIPNNIKEIKPDILLSVPALAKNFKKNIEKGIKAKGPRVERMFNKALNVAYRYNGIGIDKGKGSRKFLKPIYKFYDKLLFSKIRDNFGGHLKFFVGGGALLDMELQRFFYAIGIPIYQGYGLSEASPVISSNSHKHHKLGSSGMLVKNMDLQICDDLGIPLSAGKTGEIVIKGKNVMKGYWKNEKASAETIKNDWLHTGDMGHLDKDGYLHVSGRFKSLLIANDGEKFSPEGIEEAFLDQSPYIDQCILYNNQNPYTIAIIVPNKGAIQSYLKEQGLDSKSDEGQNEALKLLQSELNAYKTGGKYQDMFPQRWMPTAVGILPEAFTEENKLVNSTMKVVRDKVISYFKDYVDYLYTPDGKNFFNLKNKETIQKF